MSARPTPPHTNPIELGPGGLSDVPCRPRFAVVPELRGPNGLTFDLAFIWKAPEYPCQLPYPSPEAAGR